MAYRYVPKSMVFSEVTNEIAVKVVPKFLSEQSELGRKEFVWSYNVEIENNSLRRVKLMRRHWSLTDAEGRTEEVVGAGVVGQQPVLEPGQKYTYASHAVLRTSTGFMRGDYDMVDENGSQIKVNVPAFSLDEPHSRPILN